jgi:hypothetical protein
MSTYFVLDHLFVLIATQDQHVDRIDINSRQTIQRFYEQQSHSYSLYMPCTRRSSTCHSMKYSCLLSLLSIDSIGLSTNASACGTGLSLSLSLSNVRTDRPRHRSYFIVRHAGNTMPHGIVRRRRSNECNDRCCSFSVFFSRAI